MRTAMRRFREQIVTAERAVVFTMVTSLALGCGGAPRGDMYARATDTQQSCCEHVTGSSRDACLQAIVRVDDPKVRDHDMNQATYRCVADNFSCDATTGHATLASAQAQLECIQDLAE